MDAEEPAERISLAQKPNRSTPRGHRPAASPPPAHSYRRRYEKIALRAALAAAHLLGLAAGRFLRELRGRNDPLVEATALLKEAELRASVAWDPVDMLGTRLDKIPDRHRPYSSPAQRFRILEIKSFLGWNREVAARLFRICPNTLSNWEKHADPDSGTVGSTVTPIPPITQRPVVAHFTHHVWMMDISVVQAFLGGEFYLAAVFDAFSRVPLAVSTYEQKPGASATARLLMTAARLFSSPKYLITDQGGEFTGTVFAKTAARLGIVHRFGSTKNIFATARLERFWRTLKQASSLRFHPPLTIGDLERRLDVALTHYLCFRPHQGLLGATPGEAFLALLPACRNAVSPPRGRPGEGPSLAPFVIEFLDHERKDFPFLKGA